MGQGEVSSTGPGSLSLAESRQLLPPESNPVPKSEVVGVSDTALRNAEEMIDAYLETARRESWSVPEPRGRLAFA